MRIDSPIMTNAILTGSFSGSFNGVIEETTVLTGALPSGVISGSSQVDITATTGFTSFSSSIAGEIAGLDGEYATDAQLSGVSGSLAIDITTNGERLDTLEGKTLHSSSVQVDHDTTTNFVANEHIDHSSVTITAGDGLSGGGDITTSRTIDVDNTVARTNANNTFSGDQTFNNVIINGTGSFAVIQSVTGSAKIINDAFVVVNADTPAERFAGLQVYDSGSAFTTSSFIYDGQNNQWIFQHEGSENSGSSVAIFGPLSQDGLGSEVGLTTNKVPKAITDHGHHIGDSNITDDGSTITLGSNISVTGNIAVTGTVDGRDIASDGSKLDGIATNANNYSLPEATSTVRGGIELFSDTDQSVAANAVSATADRTYGLQLNAAGQAVVNVPWVDTDTNTTYSAGGGLTLSGTTFSVQNDLRGEAWIIGRDSNDYISVDATQIDFALDGVIDMRLYNNGDLHVEGNVIGYSTSISDQKFKEEVVTIDSALDKVKALRGVEYTWNEGGRSRAGQRDLGFIAQEVEQVIPEIVREISVDGTLCSDCNDQHPSETFKTVDYTRVVAVLVEAVKEQQTQIDELTARLNANS
jgi:hypothetical protein